MPIAKSALPPFSKVLSGARLIAPGLALAIAGVVVAFQTHRVVKDPAPLVLAVLFGFVAGNLRIVRSVHQPGIKFAVKKLLRIGVVLLGFRLSLKQLQQVGLRGLIAVVLVVSVTFFFTRWFAKKLGLSPDLGLLVAISGREVDMKSISTGLWRPADVVGSHEQHARKVGAPLSATPVSSRSISE